MAKFAVTSERKGQITVGGDPVAFDVGGETITLLIRQMCRIDKVRYIEALMNHDQASAEYVLLSCGVGGWDGVQDAAGQPVRFEYANLNTILGLDNDLAVRVTTEIARRNGMLADEAGEKREVPPLARATGSGSESSSTPAS